MNFKPKNAKFPRVELMVWHVLLSRGRSRRKVPWNRLLRLVSNENKSKNFQTNYKLNSNLKFQKKVVTAPQELQQVAWHRHLVSTVALASRTSVAWRRTIAVGSDQPVQPPLVPVQVRASAWRRRHGTKSYLQNQTASGWAIFTSYEDSGAIMADVAIASAATASHGTK